MVMLKTTKGGSFYVSPTKFGMTHVYLPARLWLLVAGISLGFDSPKVESNQMPEQLLTVSAPLD